VTPPGLREPACVSARLLIRSSGCVTLPGLKEPARVSARLLIRSSGCVTPLGLKELACVSVLHRRDSWSWRVSVFHTAETLGAGVCQYFTSVYGSLNSVIEYILDGVREQSERNSGEGKKF
jgi:hypothetical protein